MNDNKIKIVGLLNDILEGEFTSVNQYWLYGLTLNHLSLSKLGKIFIKESIEEKTHVDRISKRILQLGGIPNFSMGKNIQPDQSVEKMFEVGINLEKEIIVKYQKTIAQLEEMHDYASVEILSKILSEEEHHREWLNSQLQLLKTIGTNLYLSRLMTLEMEEIED